MGIGLGIIFTVLSIRSAPFAQRLVHAVAGTATFTGSSQTLTGDITAARIVDSANSSYFIDPAAAGTSISIAGNASISGTMTTASNQAFRPAYGPVKLDYKSGLDSWSTGLLVQDTTGNVGIGTTSPGQKLSVAGTVESTTGGFKFPDGTTQTKAATLNPEALDVVTSGTTFSGGTTENTVWSFTVPGGTLGTNNMLRFVAWLRVTVASTNPRLTLRLKYGTASLVVSEDLMSSVDTYVIHIEAMLKGDGGTNAQRMMTAYYATTTSSMTLEEPAHREATATIDSTVNQTISLSSQWSAHHDNNTVTVHAATVEKMPAL